MSNPTGQAAALSTGNATNYTPSPGSVSRTDSSGLGKTDFLKLMMEQLKHQDPLSPSDPTQYLGELAQLTNVEQITNVATSSAKQVSAANNASALSLLGHTVTYIDGQGNTASGKVTKVDMSANGGPTVTVDTKAGIGLSEISAVS